MDKGPRAESRVLISLSPAGAVGDAITGSIVVGSLSGAVSVDALAGANGPNSSVAARTAVATTGERMTFWFITARRSPLLRATTPQTNGDFGQVRASASTYRIPVYSLSALSLSL